MAEVSMEEDLPCTEEVRRITVTVSSDIDELGNHVSRETFETVMVFGWWIDRSSEPNMAGHARLVIDVKMIAPTGVFSDSDLVELPGITTRDGRPARFEVDGRGQGVDHNPWLHVGREPLTLKEVTG